MHSLSVPKENITEKEQHITDELKRIMDSYGNTVLRTAYLYLKDYHKAEDAFQEVFIRVFRKYGSFKGESSIKTWITRITINVCNDMLRSPWFKRVMVADDIGSHGAASDTESIVMKKAEDKLLFDEVASLQPAYKDVIILYYYHELDTAEISRVLNIAEGTVRSRLHRARELLRQKLGGKVDFSE